MPFPQRIAGIDLSLLGPPLASHINKLSTDPSSTTLAPYPCQSQAATASPPGHKINQLTRKIGHGTRAYRRAAASLETGKALELPWARFWRVGSAKWSPGDIVVVGARVLPFLWTANVNRVVSVSRRRRAFSVGWGTTKRHVLQGEEVLEVLCERNGDVIFRLRSFSRPRAFVAWLTYPVVLVLQRAFARDVSRQLERVANAAD